jgi:hypothetical protein
MTWHIGGSPNGSNDSNKTDYEAEHLAHARTICDEHLFVDILCRGPGLAEPSTTRDVVRWCPPHTGGPDGVNRAVLEEIDIRQLSWQLIIISQEILPGIPDEKLVRNKLKWWPQQALWPTNRHIFRHIVPLRQK